MTENNQEIMGVFKKVEKATFDFDFDKARELLRGLGLLTEDEIWKHINYLYNIYTSGDDA